MTVIGEATDYGDPFGEYAEYLAEMEAEQDHRNAEEYAMGVRNGEVDGRAAYADGTDTLTVAQGDPTPYSEGYADGFCGGYNSARRGM